MCCEVGGGSYRIRNLANAKSSCKQNPNADMFNSERWCVLGYRRATWFAFVSDDTYLALRAGKSSIMLLRLREN